MPLRPGDKAPDFTLLDQNGEPFTLSKSLRQRKAAHLIYFYPKADTPGCTTQACGLRDVLDRIGDTVVVGISPDPPARQKRFDDKYSLGFPLLADEDHSVAEKYGAWGEKSMYGKKYMGIIRSAVLVDRTGKVAEAWPRISPKETPEKLLAALGS
jgi:peroxiredoxin Q/BCP